MFNYNIYTKELLNIMKVLNKWKLDLESISKLFEIIIKYKNFKKFGTSKKFTPKHIRWLEFLFKFRSIIKY